MKENNEISKTTFESLFKEVSSLIEQSKSKVVQYINSEIVHLNWNLGRIISENILENSRADYGKQVLKQLSNELSLKYGRGFNETNLRNCLRFYQLFPDSQIPHSLSDKLSWTHIRNLIYNEQIEIAEYTTKIPDKTIFAEKLHLALIEARKEFENRDEKL